MNLKINRPHNLYFISLLKSRNFRALIFLLLFYVAFGTYLTWQQEKIIYQPPTTTVADCPALTGAILKEVNGTRMYVLSNTERIVVLYHGNAGSVCDRVHYANLIANAGWGYILVSYTGYDEMVTLPTHALIREDVHNVIKSLEDNPAKQIFIIGESLGAGVASYHTSITPPDALLLITPFSSLRDLAKYHYWYYPTRWLVKEAYDNQVALADYQGRVVILHGTKDRIVPISLAEKLYTNLNTANKEFVSVDSADHNDLWWYPETTQAVQSFLRSE